MKDGLFQVLFVCTGNICRSPMAEGILRARLSPRTAEFATVGSAGTGAGLGFGASPHSIEACRRHRIDISGHMSRPVTRSMIAGSDLILVMEQHHREWILQMNPGATDRTCLISEYAEPQAPGPPPGIMDPIGMDIGVYLKVFEDIDHYVQLALPRMEAFIAQAVRSH